jgi:hypothetical protein
MGDPFTFEYTPVSAYVRARWRGAKEKEYPDVPEFGDGGACWADWLALVTDRFDLEAILRKLGVSELLAHTVPDSYWFQGTWVQPQRMLEAAERMQELIKSRSPELRPLVEVYALHAVGAKSIEEEFVGELRDVKRIAEFLQERGAKKMTLEVAGW